MSFGDVLMVEGKGRVATASVLMGERRTVMFLARGSMPLVIGEGAGGGGRKEKRIEI